MDYSLLLFMFVLTSSALAEDCTECGVNTQCQCVRPRNCRLTMDVLRPCQTSLFCCPQADILQQHKQIVAWPKFQSASKLSYIRGSWIMYPEGHSRIRTTTAPPTTTTTAANVDECGVVTADLDRISGGEEVKIGQYPWIVALRYAARANKSDVRNLCGGSLITRQHVLTAAHCVKNIEYDLVAVVAGEYNTSGDPDCMTTSDGTQICTNAVVVRPESVHAHPQYRVRTFANDIAVVKLEKELPISDTIRTICLPSGDRQLALGDSALIAGWGKTSINSWPSPVLLYAGVDVQDIDNCTEVYREKQITIRSPQMFCAGKDNKDACPGDSGGPFMVVYQGRFHVMGVVSFGHDDYCGIPGVPGVYANVTNYLEWIGKNII